MRLGNGGVPKSKIAHVIPISKPSSPVNTTFILKTRITCKYSATKLAIRVGQRNMAWRRQRK